MAQENGWHDEKVRAVHDAIAFTGIVLADEGNAILRHHNVEARSVDVRLGLVVPHDREAAVSDERSRHVLILVVTPGGSLGVGLRRLQGYAAQATARSYGASVSSARIARSRPRREIPLDDV